MSYGFTKSTALPLPCTLNPAFNTSEIVAALLPIYSGFGFPFANLGLANLAASSAVIGPWVTFALSSFLGTTVPSGFVISSVPSFTLSRLFFTLPKDVGVVTELFGAASVLLTFGFVNVLPNVTGFASGFGVIVVTPVSGFLVKVTLSAG